MHLVANHLPAVSNVVLVYIIVYYIIISYIWLPYGAWNRIMIMNIRINKRSSSVLDRCARQYFRIIL